MAYNVGLTAFLVFACGVIIWLVSRQKPKREPFDDVLTNPENAVRGKWQ